MSLREQQVIQFLCSWGKSRSDVRKIILFGSRARGDAHERSDFDVAVEAPGITLAQWSRWALELQENVPTLCGLDLVLLNEELSVSLVAVIEREGQAIYVR